MEQEFYKLDEAAELLECTAQDLLKLGMSGKIDLCTWYWGRIDRDSIPDNAFTGRPAPEKNVTINELLPIRKEDIKKFVFSGRSQSNEEIEIGQIMWPGCDSPLHLIEEDIFNTTDETRFIKIRKEELCIMNKTFSALKAELHKSPVEQGTLHAADDKITAILDPTHPWHSELLATVVKGWLEHYYTREGDRHDSTYKPAGGHINMLTDWLKENEKLLSKTAIKNLAQVMNPDKRGGASKTPEQ